MSVITNEVLMEIENQAIADRIYNELNSAEALNKAIAGLEGAAASFARDCIKDGNLRASYNVNIKRVVGEVRQNVVNRKISLYEASKFCNQIRNRIMDEIRAALSPTTRAYSVKLKSQGKSFEYLAEKNSQEIFKKSYSELSTRDKSKIHYAILSSAAKGNKRVNLESKLLKYTGRVLIVVTAAIAIYSIYHAEDRYKEAAKQAGIIGGGVAGGAAGGAVASVYCGPGAPVCFFAFAAVGAMVGGIIGSVVMEEFYEEAEEFIKWNIL